MAELTFSISAGFNSAEQSQQFDLLNIKQKCNQMLETVFKKNKITDMRKNLLYFSCADFEVAATGSSFSLKAPVQTDPVHQQGPGISLMTTTSTTESLPPVYVSGSLFPHLHLSHKRYQERRPP